MEFKRHAACAVLEGALLSHSQAAHHCEEYTVLARVKPMELELQDVVAKMTLMDLYLWRRALPQSHLAAPPARVLGRARLLSTTEVLVKLHPY